MCLVNLRGGAVIGRVSKWLVREFAPHHMSETLRALAEAPQRDTTSADDGNTARKIADCDRRLAQYRAALDAGANPATVAAWIAETEAEKAGYQVATRPADGMRRRMSEAEIRATVDRLADLVSVLADADPDDKSEIFRRLGLRLTYYPGRGLVEAQIMPAECGFFESVRGGT
jgi:site-specific DNA recombinase